MWTTSCSCPPAPLRLHALRPCFSPWPQSTGSTGTCEDGHAQQEAVEAAKGKEPPPRQLRHHATLTRVMTVVLTCSRLQTEDCTKMEAD
mmetsp:Transcript_148794/g.414559  ORF Transcript_148794/g.414559 Transcript_148794/m.414559 type:complete len:89 (+) Transcript_148794:1412-1678(+)